jgi:hypothetical protein
VRILGLSRCQVRRGVEASPDAISPSQDATAASRPTTGQRRAGPARPDTGRLRGDLQRNLDEDGQVEFKGKAKAFVRTYGFLSSVLPYSNASWEKLSIFLNFLIPKLPAPKEEDLARGLLETIDMDSYRVEKRAAIRIALADENAEIGPVPTSGGGRRPEPELDRLSSILQTCNEQFGDIDWQDKGPGAAADHGGHPSESGGG